MEPNGWEVKELQFLCKKIAVGLAISVTPFMRTSGVKLIRNQNIKRNYFNSDSVVYIDEVFANSNKSKKVRHGDVVAVRTGSNIGEACVVPKDFDGALTFTTLIARPNPELLDSFYLSTHINSERGISEVNRLCAGGGKPNLNSGELKRYRLLTPPLAEQKKIAQILSTWGKAITTTEQLLANSQQQKKALMQQLLTGKKRLLDQNGERFSGDWEAVILGELGSTYSGLTGKTKEDFGKGKPYIPYINIFRNSRIDLYTVEKVDIASDEKQASAQYGDIFFTTSSEVPEEVGMSSVLLDHVKDLYLNSFCFGFRLNSFDALQPEYARYLFRSEQVRRAISVMGQGATRYNLSKKQLMKLELTLPPIPEQQKIAAVLSAADQEITTLQQQLDRLKQEKKALMQQLLSGMRRVKIDYKEIA